MLVLNSFEEYELLDCSFVNVFDQETTCNASPCSGLWGPEATFANTMRMTANLRWNSCAGLLAVVWQYIDDIY